MGKQLVMTLKVHRVFILVPFLIGTTSNMQIEQSNLDKPLALYFETKLEQALPLFEQIVNKHQKNPEAQTWLAETYRRLGRKEDAIRTARTALGLSPCYSFAHLVLAQASYPNNDTIAVHVTKAIECDSTDPNGWLMMWGEAIRHADPTLRDKCLRKLVETGFFTKAALAYGRAELRTLPKDAILLTNGDMDTYPAQAVQVTEGFRTDVAVVEREHLGITWACRFMRDYQNIPLPIPDAQLDLMKDSTGSSGTTITTSDQMFRSLLNQKQNGTMDRPLALAPTVEEGFYSWNKEHFKYQGMFFLWQPEHDNETADTTSFRKCLSGIDPEDFTGPWASLKDRSPVRRYYTKRIVGVLFEIALTYSKELIKAKRYVEGEKTLQWLEDFEQKTELGQVSTEEIVQLRNSITKHTR
jgi:tetratricopeptide (TPR) repeat protein